MKGSPLQRQVTLRRRLIFLLIVILFTVPDCMIAAEGAGWQAEWEKTVEAAKSEGQVNVYIYNVAAAVIQSGVFQRRFPEIKVLAVPGRGFESQQRVLTERRAGKYLADVLSSGVTTYAGIPLLAMKSALILPEVVDESKWYLGRHRYGDAENRHIFIYAGVPQLGSVRYNTELVSPKEIKRSAPSGTS